MREKQGRLQHGGGEATSGHPSPLDLIRLMGGRSKPAGPGVRERPDSVLAVYKDRFTYTFIMNDEVASIHFDRRRGEIFFRGHNISHMDLSAPQRMALVGMEEVLAADEHGKSLCGAYSATLARLLADKYK
jgi:hypothetical protein